jgi:hypothetical protein
LWTNDRHRNLHSYNILGAVGIWPDTCDFGGGIQSCCRLHFRRSVVPFRGLFSRFEVFRFRRSLL